MQAMRAPSMSAPADKLVIARLRCCWSGSWYRRVGLLSTRTTARRGVEGFMRSIAASAMSANATTQKARVAAPAAVIETIENETIRELMNNLSVPLPPPERPTDVRSLRIALPLLTVSWLLLASIIVMAAVRIQRWELAPGEASAVAPLVEFAPVKGGEPAPTRYRAENGINFVTAFGGQLSVLDTLVGWLDPHVDVHTYKEHFGDQTPTDSRRLGYQAMVGAKQIADYVAMKLLGLDVALVQGKILVEELVCEGAPTSMAACAELAIGETIVGFNGVKVETLSDLATQMKGLTAGTRVTLSVLPYEQDEDETADPVDRTIQLMTSPDNPSRVIIGIVPADTRTVRVPFDVQISTSGIGGPSAGLAFTLSLLDELTPGNLMGRGRVVATGTINEDGSVGPIGALEQKAVAVKDAGGTLFLVPAGQSETEMKAARAAAGSSVTIVQVGTIKEALVQLGKNGGEGLPALPQ